jgi:type VI secretion system protein ImpB
MAKDPSIAPKERVNIVYRPAIGDAKEEVELPLKMLVMGDFTGRTDDRPLERREPVNIDKDNFNDVLKAQEINLNLSVPNRLSGNADDAMNLSLKVESMKDFGPEAIVEQVPELKRLLELREALRALKGPLSNVPEFRKKIQELLKDENASAKLLAEIGIEE